MSELADRVVLVTGSTRGIGRAMAVALAAQGALVVVNGTRQSDADEVAAQIPGSVAMAADIGDRVAVAGLIDRVVEKFGRLDVLVNNAGVGRTGAITRLTDDDWDWFLAVNLTGPTMAIRAVVPHMKRQGGGSIINVVSVAATEGAAGMAGYGASKAGLIGLTRSLAKELERFSIRVNAISPIVLTDINAHMDQEAIGRVAVPASAVADVTAFLASDAARFVSGQILAVHLPG